MNEKTEVIFSEDLLYGAAAIAEFLFGDRTKVRRIYYLSHNSRMPFLRIGSKLCLRISVAIAWVEQQEGRCPGFIRSQGFVAIKAGQNSSAVTKSGSKAECDKPASTIVAS